MLSSVALNVNDVFLSISTVDMRQTNALHKRVTSIIYKLAIKGLDFKFWSHGQTVIFC